MSHNVSLYNNNVLLLRLTSKVIANELHQDLKNTLDDSTSTLIVIVDFSMALELSQQAKSVLYKDLQINRVLKVGFCGMTAQQQSDWEDLITLLGKVRPVVIGATERDVRQQLGLVAVTSAEPKMRGMLSYLRKA